MNDDARLFYALWPDEQTRARLRQLQASVTGRRVSPENLHLTLAFLGNQTKSLMPTLAALIHHLPDQSFTLALDRYGYFIKPRIVWAGPSETPAPLLELQQSLMDKLSEAQVPLKREEKFKPHVSLARDASSLNEPFEPTIVWQVSKIMLIESVQMKGGVLYSPIAERVLV